MSGKGVFKAVGNESQRNYLWDQAEIDYIEEGRDGFTAFELKWNDKKSTKFSTTFTDFYQPKDTFLINRSNFWNQL